MDKEQRLSRTGLFVLAACFYKAAKEAPASVRIIISEGMARHERAHLEQIMEGHRMMLYIQRHIVAVFFVLRYLFSLEIWLWVNGTVKLISLVRFSELVSPPAVTRAVEQFQA